MRADGTTLIAAAQQKLAELEASMSLAIGSVRASLVLVEEENRELRRESLERRTEYYTEREVALILKVSYSTVARLRAKGKLRYLRIGTQIRYSSEQLAMVGETFTADFHRRKKAGRQRQDPVRLLRDVSKERGG